jgi:hypothetical protein
MLKNKANQKWRVIAFRPDNSRVLGDADNITAKISIDGSAPVPLNDVHPEEVEDGYYRFELTKAETNGSILELYPESSTSEVLVLGDPPSVSPYNIIGQAR